MSAATQTPIDDFVKTARAARAAGDRKTALATFQAATARDPDNLQLKLDIATELRALGRVAEAAEIYRSVRAQAPRNLAATVGLAQLSSEKKNYEVALELFREAHELNHQHVGVRLEIGKLLRELGRLDEAEEAYAKVIEHNPQEIRAVVGCAQVRRARNDREASLATLRTAAQFAPNNAKLQIEIANDLRHLNRAVEASEILDQIIAQDPTNFDARLALAHLKREQGDRLGSLAQFREAAALNPNLPGPRLQAAQDLRELGRFDEAEASINDVLARHPDNFDAHAALGNVKRQRGDRHASLAQFRKASALNPGHTGLKLQIAQGLRELGQLDEAETLLEAILSGQPNNFEAHLGLGHVARQRGDRALSLGHFERASALNPRHAGPKLQCVQILRDLGQLEKAETILAEVLTHEPTNMDARVGRAHIHRSRGDRQRSLQELRDAMAINPQHVGVRLEVANDLREIGRTAEALDTINCALTLDQNNANAHAQLGQLHRSKGNYQGARESYAKAIDCAPHTLSFKIELANCNRDLGLSQVAEAELASLVAENPDNVQATVSLATLLIEAFRLDEAGAVLDKIAGNEPSMPILLALGRLARRADQRAEAISFFQRAHEDTPEHPAPLLELLQEHRAQGNLAEARSINETLANRGASLQTLLDRGRIHRDHGERDLAIEAFELAIEKFPEAWQAKLELAIERRLLGDPKEAERILKSILEDNRENFQAIDHLIEQLRMAEQYDDALEYSLKLIDLRPSSHAPYLKAANIASRLGQIELTWKLLEDAQRRAGLHPEITAARLELLRFLRKLREADAVLASLPAERTNHFAVRVQAVQNAIALGEVDIARERLALLRPQTAMARATVFRLLGKIQEISWQHEEAIAQYELSLESDPNNAGTYHELAKCSLLLFEPNAALGQLQKSLELGKSGNILRGASHNSSQNHMGQLINEFLLDSDLLAELASLKQLGRQEKLDRIVELVRKNPDNTASAIAFLVELRKAGRFSINSDTGRLHIPKSIVQFWDDPNPPEDILEICASWSHFNPDFTYRLFNERTAGEFLRDHHPPQVYAAFNASREPAQKADLFRLAYLAVCGGFYADSDDRCATTLHDFIPSSALFAGYQEEYGTLGNNFIGAMPGHPVIRRALDHAVEAINRNDNDIIWLLTGPGLLTRAYASVAAEHAEPLLSQSAIFTVGEIQRYLENHCPVSYKLTHRHWLKSSFSTRRMKAARFKMALSGSR